MIGYDDSKYQDIVLTTHIDQVKVDKGYNLMKGDSIVATTRNKDRAETVRPGKLNKMHIRFNHEDGKYYFLKLI